jgi:outer membrane immunogenic protein
VPGLASASADVEGLACGVGGKPFLTERHGVRLDASRYEGDDSEADLFTIGGVVKF